MSVMQVFLSYSQRDEPFAHALLQNLVERGIDVWNPNVQLMPGSNWLLETGRALEKAEGVVFLFSKDSARSPWSRKEVEYAITQPKFEGHLVSVLLESGLDIPWILHRLPTINAVKKTPNDVASEIAEILSPKSRPKAVRRTSGSRKTASKR